MTLVLTLAGLAHSATHTVTSLADSGDGSLRQVIADALAGDAIVFGVTGMITLAGNELVVAKDLAIIGPGIPVLAINGAGASRVFNIQSNVTALIAGLTITNGRTPDVIGSGPSEPGGGVHNYGSLWLSNCVVAGNRTGSAGTNGVAGGGGGGIYNVGALRLDDSSITGNGTGGGAANGSGGDGGGVWNGGTFYASRCSFNHNGTASGNYPSYNDYSPGGGGSGGRGGGIFNSNAMALADCTISNNATGRGGEGGYGILYGGPGGPGGAGGGIYSQDRLSLLGCTIVSNRTGWGGAGGYAAFNRGVGGNGGSGAGIFASGRIVLTNCTLTANSCGMGGAPGPWSGPNGGCGGGIHYGINTTEAMLVACTIVSNFAGMDPIPLSGSGGGLFANTSDPLGLFLNNIAALNGALTGPDVQGDFNSLGHNLIGVTNHSSGFTARGDLTGSSATPLGPKVAPLANNGGPTLTMALLAGSPAIDAADSASPPATDQRGVPRTFGAAADIGAYEYAPLLKINRPSGNGLDILLRDGTPGQICRLLTSTNGADWACVVTNQVDANGVTMFQSEYATNQASRFFRAVMP